VGEKLGARISWNEADGAITVKANGHEVKIGEHPQLVTVDKKPFDLQRPVRKVEERTMVPLSFFQEALQYKVDYQADQREVKISLPLPQ